MAQVHQTISAEWTSARQAHTNLPAWTFVLLALLAIALRASTFGDPNLHDDETFYQTVGIAMHHGVVPYVDVWDRKPWGLFFLYYLIAFLSHGPLAYQLVATAFAAATAWVIAQIALSWSARTGALLAGASYLLWLETFQGFGGQAPIFYNLFIAVAALLVWRARSDLLAGRAPHQLMIAMLLGGSAIMIKPTAFFEASFLGLYASSQLLRSGRKQGWIWRRILLCALVGALPTLFVSSWYAFEGYWQMYWHAMVTSNLAKPGSLLTSAIRATITFTRLAPLLVLLALALSNLKGTNRRFLLFWILAAFCGLVSVPAFHLHYSLPILVPLCAASAAFFERRLIGIAAFLLMAAIALHDTQAIDFDHARRSRHAMARLATDIREHGNGPLFVYDGPSQLYALTGHRFLSPLVFSPHLEHAIEKDVSHLSTLTEVRRVLGLHPAVVVMSPIPRESPPNKQTVSAVRNYVRANCQQIDVVRTPLWLREDKIAVWGDCR